MPRGKKLTDDFLMKVFNQVRAYQSEHNCKLNVTISALSKEYGVSEGTLEMWYYSAKKLQGKNPVISTVAKQKDVTIGFCKPVVKKQPVIKKQPVKVAATSVSTQLDAEKAIFNYVKSLSFFKRILACIIGLDKLCYNYGEKKMD